MTEPKLLTEADMVRFNSTPWREIKAELRERGLIAPEPVDPLLIEAREISAKYWEGQGDHLGADGYRVGDKDDWASAQIALAALKRGMELVQPKPLTWEEVRDAYLASKGSGTEAGLITRLHAALLECLQ